MMVKVNEENTNNQTQILSAYQTNPSSLIKNHLVTNENTEINQTISSSRINSFANNIEHFQ